MKEQYSINPFEIGDYNKNTNVLVTTDNIHQSIDPFKHHQLNTSVPKVDNKIIEMKARQSVPEKMMEVGTRISKSCNMPGININRFENPHCDVQNPGHIIINEEFRGGIPSRMVTKDEYVHNQK